MRYIYVALLFILSATAINAQNPILSWAHGMGSLSSEDGYSLTLDDSGSVFTTGSFKGTMDFDPGPDTFNLSPPGATGIFVSKLDASGDFKWAVSMGSSSSASRGECIAIDPFGNVYVTGMFMGTADLDPGPATYNLTSAGGSDAYVVKLDVFGNFIWAVSFGTTSSEIGYGITVDNLGNVFTCGTFSNTVDFDPGLATSYITSNGSVDVFIQKLDPAGNLIWAKALGGAQSDFGSSIQVDNSGNVYTTGYFQGNADFNPSGSTNNLSSNGSRDVFISKLNSSGNFVWAQIGRAHV